MIYLAIVACPLIAVGSTPCQAVKAESHFETVERCRQEGWKRHEIYGDRFYRGLGRYRPEVFCGPAEVISAHRRFVYVDGEFVGEDW